MKRTLTFVLLALVAMTGCGSDEEPLATGDDPGDDDVASAIRDPGEYRSVDVVEDGQPKDLVEGTTVALRFTDGQLSTSAGCNTFGARYTLQDGVLEVAEGHVTEMGCEPDRMDQDTWLFDFVASTPRIEPAEDGFTLATDRTSIRFVDREVAEPDAELVGTTWTETGFIDQDTAMSMEAPREGRRGTLRFEENGFVTGFDGCNELGYAENAAPDDDASDLGLTYDVDGDRISFEGSPTQTLVGCEGDYTERFRAVLSGTVAWEIEASSLTLMADDGRGVTFTAGG